MGNLNWWSSYGDFDPGDAFYPHAGQVVAYYRKKRGFTQRGLAIALGKDERTIQLIEASMNIDSFERRQLLAKLLRIPPVLLALDARFFNYSGSQVIGANTQEPNQLEIEGDTYVLYRQILHLIWKQPGYDPFLAQQIDMHVSKLKTIVKKQPNCEKERWQDLLCQYYHLATRIKQHAMQKDQALQYAQLAVELATEMDNVELVANSLFRRARMYMEHSTLTLEPYGQQQYWRKAQTDAEGALSHIEHIGDALKGNIYLIAAEVNALFASNDGKLRSQCLDWQTKVGNILYRGPLEDDGSLTRLNKPALHHEQAKILLQFGRVRDARDVINRTWKSLSPPQASLRTYIYLTEAKIFMAEKELEGSARCGVEACAMATIRRSQKQQEEIKQIYKKMVELDENNPYVCRLGVELNMF
jgi:transcriptional regulator with XRE-family HTH domain